MYVDVNCGVSSLSAASIVIAFVGLIHACDAGGKDRYA